MESVKKEMTLVFAGDSITDGDHLWDPGQLGLGCGYVHMVATALLKEGASGREQEYRIINSGFNGFRAIDLSRRFQSVCMDKEPDLVSLLVGVNEAGCAAEGMVTEPATFRRTYTGMIDQVLATGADMILMEPFLFAKPAYLLGWRPYFDSIREVVRKVAEEYKLPLILLDEPLNQLAQGLGPDEVTLDGIHLTDLGNRFLADQWLACFRDNFCT